MSDDYTYLQNKAWKSITYNWDILSHYGNTSRMYCLTDFQAAWLLSTTGYMAWSTRWENCPCTDEDLIAMKAELDYRLMECVDFQPFQMQYLYNQAQQAELNHLAELWDADPTPSSVNPLTPDDDFSGDGSQERLDALCMACKIYVYSYAQNWVTQAQIVLGIVAVVGLAASISIIGGIIASVLVGGLAYITSLALAAMQDENALNDVVCCMFDTLTGQAITQANFEVCLDSCGFTPGSNQAIIRDILAADIGQFNNYLTFINQVGNSYEYANNGIVDCPCNAPSWEHTFDFTVDDGGFVAINGLGGARGQWVPITGWTTTSTQVVAGSYRRGLYISRTFAERTITEISFTANYTKGSTTAGSQAAQEIFQVLLGTTQDVLLRDFDHAVNGAPMVMTFTNQEVCDEIRILLTTSSQGSASYSGSAGLLSCTVKGNGANPF